MEQPLHTLGRPSAAQATPGRLVGIVIVVVIHLIVILALITGLAQQLMQKHPSELMAKVEETPPPPEKLPPPPPPEMVKPPPPFVPPPDIAISNEAPVTNTITTQAVVATPPPVQKPAGITAPASIGRPHNCPQGKWYPPMAIRLNQEGTTTLAFKITADGSITDVTVAESSGHDSLDQAAISCAQSWQYKPAMQNGSPVEVPWKASIKWSLAGG
jgi:protein TonB